jgi:hypothetical protein
VLLGKEPRIFLKLSDFRKTEDLAGFDILNKSVKSCSYLNYKNNIMKNNELNKDLWLKKSQEKFGDNFDYSHVKYKNSVTHVAIICKRHGLLLQTPSMHLNYGCKACNSNRLSTKEFFTHLSEIHDDKYDYSKSLYSPFFPLSDMMIITCKIHGDFVQRIQSHQEGHGCPVCRGKNEINELPDSDHNSSEEDEPLGVKFKADISFTLRESDINVNVNTEPFPSKEAASEFVENMGIIIDLIDADIKESKVSENVISLKKNQSSASKNWLRLFGIKRKRDKRPIILSSNKGC